MGLFGIYIIFGWKDSISLRGNKRVNAKEKQGKRTRVLSWIRILSYTILT